MSISPCSSGSSFQGVEFNPVTISDSENEDYDLVEPVLSDEEEGNKWLQPPSVDFRYIQESGELSPFVYPTLIQSFSDSESDSDSELSHSGRVSDQDISTSNFKSIDELTISYENQQKIQNLLETLATSRIAYLISRSIFLRNLGEELKRAVHPYRFLLEILLTKPSKGKQSSKEHLKIVYGYHLEERKNLIKMKSQIWNDFVKGLGENFENRHGIDSYRKSFAETLNVDPNQVLEFESNKAWADLVIYISGFKDDG